MFGFLESFVEIKRVAKLRPNIMFGFSQLPEKTNPFSDLIIPQRLCANGSRTLYLAIIL
jgi:hypothetical protein